MKPTIGVVGLVMQSVAGVAIARFGARRMAMILLPAFVCMETLLINTPSPPVIPGSPTPSVPEPGTWAMMLIGLMVTAQIVKRSRGSATAE